MNNIQSALLSTFRGLCVPAIHSQRPGTLSLLLFRTVSARLGPCPGQVFSYSNRTKNYIPVLAIPVSFMKFPGSLHPPKVGPQPGPGEEAAGAGAGAEAESRIGPAPGPGGNSCKYGNIHNLYFC